ncbi:MAG: hypothetical protein HON60_00020 [Gammaproteobacteria bacterium]|nr:hypothetical protein [Gammaproteobacteria bacterium]
MAFSIILLLIWLALGLRSGFAEYRYYLSVRSLEPQIWEKLGSPKYLKIPMVFVSPKGAKLLQTISNETVRRHALQHRQAGAQFLAYVVVVLLLAIAYFKTA